MLAAALHSHSQRTGRAAVQRESAAAQFEDHPEAPPVTVGGDGVAVGVSAALMERILTPLLDNARRYAVHRITVESGRRPGGVQVAVADDGCGVPEAVGAAVFEAGRRAHPGDGHDGAGLGLPWPAASPAPPGATSPSRTRPPVRGSWCHFLRVDGRDVTWASVPISGRSRSPIRPELTR
ncbi:hypothetical protein GCM10009760_49530 [Kitasatospora kazusensis]|uniref:histidine kinase n=1 Tax=Kitasatospora kazusensis TaxID=407974 RepID=A0ABN3A2J3_9ACTN